MIGSDEPSVLVLVADPGLQDDLMRLAAAAGVTAAIGVEPAAAGPLWARVPLVLVGGEELESCAAAALPSRPGVVVVAVDPDDEGVWRRALEVGAQGVVRLPDAESWLVQAMADAAGDGKVPAPVVAVTGARGGAGASVLAGALATTAVREGLTPYLLDLDPLGAGLDVLLGAERVHGVRWHDLGAAVGRVPSGALREGLPCVGGVRLLAFDPARAVLPPPGVVGSVVDAASRDGDVVVVDLPRWSMRGRAEQDPAGGMAAEVLPRSSLLVLVCPADVRSALSGGRLMATEALRGYRSAVVVRGPSPGGLAAADIAAALGMPLLGSMAAEGRLDRSLDDGDAPAHRGRGPLAGLARRLLADLAVEPVRGAA